LVKAFYQRQYRVFEDPVERDRAMVLAQIDAQPVRIADSGEVWSDAQGGYPVDSSANNIKFTTKSLTSFSIVANRLNFLKTHLRYTTYKVVYPKQQNVLPHLRFYPPTQVQL
jgi:hypothetical protein